MDIYLSDDEEKLLEEKMRLAGITTVSAFIRRLIKYSFVYEVDYAPIREMNMQLGKIGGNINQIAHRANTTNSVYQEDMKDIKEMVRQVWRIQESILSLQPSVER